MTRLRVFHEVAQQLELRGGQVQFLTGPGDFAGVDVEHEVSHHEFGGVHGGHPGALDQPVQAQQHLFHAERLGDVVIAAGRQSGDAVLDGILGGEEQRRHLRRERADPAQQFDAVEPGQHHVQHQHVGAELLGEPDGSGPVLGHGHGPAGHPQPHAHELGEAGLVVHHEGADGGAVRMRELGKVVGHGVRSGHGDNSPICRLGGALGTLCGTCESQPSELDAVAGPYGPRRPCSIRPSRPAPNVTGRAVGPHSPGTGSLTTLG